MSEPSINLQTELADIAAFFARGNEFAVTATLNPNVAPYKDVPMLALFYVTDDASGSPMGVIAQVSQDKNDRAAMVYLPFAEDGSTVCARVPARAAKYIPADGNTTLVALDDGWTGAVTDFCPSLGSDLDNAKARAAERVAAAAAVPPPAPTATPLPYNPSLDFPNGTIFQIARTENTRFQRFVGRTFKVVHVDAQSVLGVPDRYSGCENILITSADFDGLTSFTVNPAGSFEFPNGVQAGGQVWNSATQQVTYVEQIVPAYVPPPVVYYDPWYCPVGVAAGVVAGALVADALFGPPLYYGGLGYGYDTYIW